MCAYGMTDEREVGTSGKLLLTAVEDGSVRGYDLRARSEVEMDSLCTSRITNVTMQGCYLRSEHGCTTACAVLPTGVVVSGHGDGAVCAWDIRKPG